jgi:hypothetical protein
VHLYQLPNLRFVSFDKVHAAQKVQSRTWHRDLVLSKWVRLRLEGPQATVHQINSSHVLKIRFKHHVDLLGERLPTNIK